MIVQIYEVSNLEEAKKLEELGVDYIGAFVGKGKYPRELNFRQAKEIFKSLSKGTKGVALSLSHNLAEISELVENTNPDILHLVSEAITPSDIIKIKQRFPNLKIMKTSPVVGEESIQLAKKYEGIADYLLLDTLRKKDSQIGITGETHDWNISRKIVDSVKTPVILAGGLGPDNVEEAIKKVKPAGVDSETKTDRDDGKGKDLEKVKKFVIKAKSFTKI